MHGAGWVVFDGFCFTRSFVALGACSSEDFSLLAKDCMIPLGSAISPSTIIGYSRWAWNGKSILRCPECTYFAHGLHLALFLLFVNVYTCIKSMPRRRQTVNNCMIELTFCLCSDKPALIRAPYRSKGSNLYTAIG